MSKRWYASKTLWFNVITIMLGILQVVTDVYPIDPALLAMLMGIGNVLLRFFTTTKLVK